MEIQILANAKAAIKYQACVRTGEYYTRSFIRCCGEVEGDERGQAFEKNKTKTKNKSAARREQIRRSCFLRSLWPLVRD